MQVTVALDILHDRNSNEVRVQAVSCSVEAGDECALTEARVKDIINSCPAGRNCVSTCAALLRDALMQPEQCLAVHGDLTPRNRENDLRAELQKLSKAGVLGLHYLIHRPGITKRQLSLATPNPSVPWKIVRYIQRFGIDNMTQSRV